MDSTPSTLTSISENELAQDAGDSEQIDHLHRLYRKVLDEIIAKEKFPDYVMDAAISAVIESFKYKEGHDFSEVDLNQADMRFGFSFRYAGHGAALARNRILEALDRCPQLRCILKMKQVNVISLGCGPGNDMIGFCSAMSRSHFSGKLKILLTDAISNWEDYAVKTVRLLFKGGFGEASDLFQQKRLNYLAFKVCKLPEQLSSSLMNDFHVILMCKLVSIMKNEKQTLPKKLHQSVNQSALILFIDTPFYESEWEKFFDILYLSEKDQYFCSGDSQMRDFGNHHDFVCSKSRIAVMRKKFQIIN